MSGRKSAGCPRQATTTASEPAEEEDDDSQPIVFTDFRGENPGNGRKHNSRAETGQESDDQECADESSKTVTWTEDAPDVEFAPDTNGLYGGEEGGRSTGPGTTLARQDKGLTSSVGFSNRDGKGRQLSPSQRKRANTLRRWQRRVQLNGSRERSLRTGLDEVSRMGSALGIDSATRQVGLRLFRQAAEEGLLVGRAIESIASGCLYAAARVNGYPRSFDEIAHVSRVDVNRIITAYEAVRDHFDLTLKPVDPAAYLGRFATGCDAPMEVIQAARRIIDVARERDGVDESIIGGTSPTSVAAAALFAAADLQDIPLTQQEIAEVADVHVTTIRNNYPALKRVYQEKQSE